MKYALVYKVTTLACIITAIVVVACNRELDKSNPNSPTVDTYFKNSTELLGGTNAIYSIFHSAALIGREWFFLHDTRSDDVSAGGGQLELPRAQLLNGATVASNAVMNNVWNGLYTVIHRANTVIDNGPNVTDNAALRDRCVAEAKFFRGWAYFELVSQWGPVPLYIKQVTAPDQFQPRAAADAVYTQIFQDLKDAAAGLPATTTDNGRATRGAANAVLGRAYMQKGDYANAKTALLAVNPGNSIYSLRDNYLDNFDEEHEFNSESIFEAVFFDRGDNNFNWGYTGDDQPNAQPQSTVRNQEYSPIAWRNLIPSNKFLNEFENTATGAAKTDPRFAMSVYQTGDKYNNNANTLTDAEQNGNSSVVNGVTKKISWRKFMLIYKDNNGFHPGGINQRIIRYAEVLLMLAECENELDNPAGAIGYLNQVRDRASVAMPHYPTTQYPTGNKTQIARAIIHEKTVELGGEEIRNRDILRWRKKGYFTTDPISYYKARDEFLPIPQAEIDNNPKLAAGGIDKQNAGY
ncbi:RagB/SusD family nutrient uptake outer membrane protein [Pseudoflavitalea sp. X16]|uniref:RagB/SusD family nutrient uptake outer membrane protein n=1 Tax=Paraflavitalea devenefica TaxID=2716334 RepID=UPI001422F677|nr:RagB/SusD family nutrient uptake outer membrane protein [Paraflavitalea devenefica]NII27904.1 RagB/SusD family nutrient uptake outer membrane protein [Paraflavitalea devenefica]